MHKFKLLFALFLALLLPVNALAISSVYETIYSASALDATATGTAFCWGEEGTSKVEDIVLYLNGDYVSGTGTTAIVKVQYAGSSSAAAADWFDLETFTTVGTTDDTETIHLPNDSTHVLKCMRAVATLAGTTPVYNLTVRAYYRRVK